MCLLWSANVQKKKKKLWDLCAHSGSAERNRTTEEENGLFFFTLRFITDQLSQTAND